MNTTQDPHPMVQLSEYLMTLDTHILLDAAQTKIHDLLMQLSESPQVKNKLSSYMDSMLSTDLKAILAGGWTAAGKLVRSTKVQQGQPQEIPGLAGLQGQHIPIPIVLKQFFAPEVATMARQKQFLDASISIIDTLIEKNPDEWTKFQASLKNRQPSSVLVQEIETTKSELQPFLDRYMHLRKASSEVEATYQTMDSELEQQITTFYTDITVDQCKLLLIYRKWIPDIEAIME